MRSPVRELATSVGEAWFVVVIGIGLGVYGAVDLVVHLSTPGWVWIVAGLAVIIPIALNVAYQALQKRNAVSKQKAETTQNTRIMFLGGRHRHYYNPESKEAGTSSSRNDG